ncbi:MULTISPECIES: ABC transporter permease [unclassified Candidatus Cardinium]|uniref:ABC transporter permease n=1 Tax=unclassified Candidatus Cardinium TaxID=2641185 RepID=UPI001FB56771|nr:MULTISPECIES: ABC transporter permease [unclassified Candidatus Cardinium]
MFSYQYCLEIFYNLKSHKTRTIFTGFGVMWAMLILVLLQGAGSGLYKHMIQKFYGYSIPIMTIRPGYRATEPVHFTETLKNDLANHLNLFREIMAVFRTDRYVTYEQAVHKSNILGVDAGYKKIKDLALKEGRFLTERDIAQRLPVCVLGLKMKTKVFDNKPAIGAFITIDGTVVTVVGLLEATAGVDDDAIMIPNSLFRGLFPKDAENTDCIISTLPPRQNPIQVAEKVRAYLAKRLNFDVADKHAIHISSSRQAKSFQLLFMIMQGFIWLISLCFLVSGVVGVGNMMLVVVKERTQELAIRKVIGAQSSDIIGLILMESIVINLISGILGLAAGIAILQLINSYLLAIIQKYGMAHFEFQLSMLLSALVILVLCGGLAGIIPAKKALSIKPVDALNNE